MEPGESTHRKFRWGHLWGGHKHAITTLLLGAAIGWLTWWIPSVVGCFYPDAPEDPGCTVGKVLRTMYGLGMIPPILGMGGFGAVLGGWIDMLYSRAKEREWYEKQLKELREHQDKLRDDDREERERERAADREERAANHKEVMDALESLREATLKTAEAGEERAEKRHRELLAALDRINSNQSWERRQGRRRRRRHRSTSG